MSEMKIEPTIEWCMKSAEIEGDSEIGVGVNPFHKPTGTYKPVVDPPPVHTLSKQERFALLLKQCPAKPAKK